MALDADPRTRARPAAPRPTPSPRCTRTFGTDAAPRRLAPRTHSPSTTAGCAPEPPSSTRAGRRPAVRLSAPAARRLPVPLLRSLRSRRRSRPSRRSAIGRAGSTRSWRDRCSTTTSGCSSRRITAQGEKPAVARHAALHRGDRRRTDSRLARADPPAQRARRSASGARSSSSPAACSSGSRRSTAATSRRASSRCRSACRAPICAAPIASREPSSIDAGGGRSLRAAGLDRPRRRERRTAPSRSGTTRPAPRFGFSEARGLRRRAADPVRALRPRARGAARARGTPGAGSSHSGYFFPGPARRGTALPDAARSREDARDAQSPDGSPRRRRVPACASPPEDCGFCDYESVCGGVGPASERAKAKLETAVRSTLRAFREMHDEG